MMPKRAWLVVATFLLAMLLYVDRICISAAKDGITRDLGLTDKQFGWALSAFALRCSRRLAAGWQTSSDRAAFSHPWWCFGRFSPGSPAG